MMKKRPSLRSPIEDEEEDPQKDEDEDVDRVEDDEEEKGLLREAIVYVLVRKLDIKNSQRARPNNSARYTDPIGSNPT
ncbi:hypothetical protein MUP77_10495 [Candidatus Bathyarchaeota archaeon]|nr:hypothetical protein [Candidatus Bathyarchaeota archaeon]